MRGFGKSRQSLVGLGLLIARNGRSRTRALIGSVYLAPFAVGDRAGEADFNNISIGARSPAANSPVAREIGYSTCRVGNNGGMGLTEKCHRFRDGRQRHCS